MENRRILQRKKLTYREYLSLLWPLVGKVAIGFFLVVVISTSIVSLNLFGIRDTLTNIFMEIFEELSGLIGHDGQIDTGGLILNNIRVAFLSLITGMIPLLFVPVFIIILNGSVIGILFGQIFAVSQVGILGLLGIFALGILPHGIFELPGIFISTAAGIILCKSTLGRGIRFVDALKFGLITVLIICIPLMMVAGVIETQVTPRLLSLVGFM